MKFRIFPINNTLNKKLNLRVGGDRCIYESFDRFRNDVNGSLYECVFESLIHTIHSETKHRCVAHRRTTVLLWL